MNFWGWYSAGLAYAKGTTYKFSLCSTDSDTALFNVLVQQDASELHCNF